MSFFNLLLVTLEQCPVGTLSEVRVWPLSERRVQSTNCINARFNKFFNLRLVTLERCPVPPLSELRVPPLSE